MIENTLNNQKKLKEYLKKRDSVNLDIVEVFSAIALFYGVKGIKKTRDILEAASYIKHTKHMVFILFDGFGYSKLKNMDNSSILKQNLVRKINTVNPTSTACVLTSIMSLKYPCEHGIYGWWNYDVNKKISYFPLLFAERKTGEDLLKKGIKPEDIFNFEPVFNKFRCKVNVYESIELINSTYTKMFSKKASNYGYRSIKDLFSKLEKNLQKEMLPTFNYVYIDGLDELSHMYGVNSKEADSIIVEVEEGIKKIINNVSDVSVVLTADHGQIEMTKMLYLNQNYDYTKYFYATPSIDTRTISFFVKEQYLKEFKNRFLSEFSEDVVLLEKEKVEELNLFGRVKFSKEAKENLGEYVAIIVNNKFMVCDKLEKEDKINTKGNHSGFTEEETKVPLIVI